MTERRLTLVTTTADLQRCYKLAAAAYPAGAPWQFATFERDWALPTARYELLWADAQLVGFISSSIVLDEAEITNVAVAPFAQHRGHATWLIQTWLATLARPSQVFLEVRVSNGAAQALYQRCGFTRYATRRNYYQHPAEDAWLMRRTLD